MLVPGLPVSGGPSYDNSMNTIRDSFASRTMVFNAQAQYQGDKINGLRAVMMVIETAHQQQLHHMEVTMVHMARNSGSPASVPTTISTMIQSQVPPPMPEPMDAGYVVPAAYAVPLAPPTSTASTNIRHSRGHRAGFGVAPLVAGGT